MSNTQKVLVKFNYNLNPVVFTVPEGYTYDLSFMPNVEWVSTIDGAIYSLGNTLPARTVTVNKPVFLSQSDHDKVVTLLRYGNPDLPYNQQHPAKITAIKVIKEATDCSLKDAKDYADKLCVEVNPRYPDSYDSWIDDDYSEPPF